MLEEKVKIKEEVDIFVRDAKTGKVKKIRLRPTRSSILHKLKKLLGLEHDSITSYGYQQMAKLLGGISPAYMIDAMKAKFDTSWDVKTSGISRSVITGGSGATLIVDNSLNPFTQTGVDYTELRCFNHSDSSNYHNAIGIQIKISEGEWWAEVRFIFS